MRKRTLFIIIGIVVIVSIIGVITISRKNNISTDLVSVERGTLSQDVFANGKIEFPTKIDLHFKGSGKIVAINTGVGETVSAGQVLAKQDTTEIDAQVSEMKAGIELQKAKLNQLLEGASAEDIRLTEIKVENARRKLYSENLVAVSDDDARKNIAPVITGSYNGLQEGQYRLFFSDYNELNNTNKISYNGIEKGKSNKDELSQPLGTKGLLIAFPSNSYQTNDRWTIDIPNKNGANYVSNLNAYNSALAELTLKKAPSRSSDIAVYQAQVNQAEALLQKTISQREDFMILAPSSGLITKIYGEVGEIVNSGKPVMSFVAENVLQIKLNIIEDRIVNVKIGQETEVTFDAIENQKFSGRVVSIDPAETEIQGAVYYETTIVLDDVDERIKSGMTANVLIRTAVSEDTLYVPISAIVNKGGKTYVEVLENKKLVDKEVRTGLKNSTGMIEITSGLKEGEQVVISTKSKV